MNHSSRPVTEEVRQLVLDALDAWPEPQARRSLMALSSGDDPLRLRTVGRTLARCGRGRREAADDFLTCYESDRRQALRTVVLFARLYLLEDEPREFLRELKRLGSLPGQLPWPAVMEALNHLWRRYPREMFRLVPPWLTHRDPSRRWVALHGLEIPARKDPRAALKVLRLLRGERHPRVRRMLGHVLGQGLYTRHPEPAMEEMARWLSDGASAATGVVRQTERQIELWFDAGMGSERQRIRLRRVATEYEEHHDPDVRAHARRILRLLES